MSRTAEKSASTAEKPAATDQPVTSAPRLREIERLVADRILGLKPCCAWKLTNLGSAGGPPLIHGNWDNPVVHDYECYSDIPEVPTTRPPDYSSDIGAAWQLVENLRERGHRIEVGSVARNQSAYTVTATPIERSDASTKGRVTHTEATAPLAICLVALRASGVDV
jgi:hypothetical protein